MNSLISFGSDNHSGVHPLILKSIGECNHHHAPSYGTDEWSNAALKKIKQTFGDHVEAFFVFNGTACNVLALQFLMQRFETALCSESAHLEHDECGAPEFFAGKIKTVPTHQGKIVFDQLAQQLVRKGDQHSSQIRVISLTQPTELGTVYSIDEIKKIVQWAKENQLFVHVDGARLSNAAHFLKISLRELTTDLGVDVVSFGGTKNGLMMGEALVVTNPTLVTQARQSLKYQRKQMGQLPSKTRFIAQQFCTYLTDGLFQQISAHSHQMALRLAEKLSEKTPFKPNYPVQSNAVFVNLPKEIVKKIREKYFFYVWDEKTFECRLMTTWDTKAEDVDGLVEEIRQNL